MAEAVLSRESEVIGFGTDSKVIIRDLGDIPGGKTLDMTGYNGEGDNLKAGHIIVKTNAGEYKPLGLNSGKSAYVTVGSTDTVVGVLKATIRKNEPMAAILTMGQVQEAALPFTVTTAIKTALPNIQFI